MKKLLLIVVALVFSVPAMTTDAGILKNLGKAIVKDQAKKLVAESQGKKYETRLDKLNKYYKNGGKAGYYKEHLEKEKAAKKATKKAAKKSKKATKKAKKATKKAAKRR